MARLEDRRVSEQLLRLPEIVFALVIAQSLVIYRDVLIDPLPPQDPAAHITAIVALLVLGVTTVLCWYDWQVTIAVRPYDVPSGRVEWGRLASDMGVVIVYAYLLFTIAPFESHLSVDIRRHLLGYPIVYVLYAISGIARRITFGPLAANLRVTFWSLAAVTWLVVVYAWLAQALLPSIWLNLIALGAVLGLVVWYRHDHGGEANKRLELKYSGPRVGVGLDGVLGNHVEGALRRIAKEYGVALRYADLSDWRTSFGPSDMATEVARAQRDHNYLKNMPLHEGAREMLRKLYPGHQIDITSARSADAREATETWLHKHRLYFDDIITVDEAKSGGADVLIDDRLDNLVAFLEKSSGRAVLIRRPWNSDDAILRPWIEEKRVAVATTLAAVPDAISQLKASSAQLGGPSADSVA